MPEKENIFKGNSMTLKLKSSFQKHSVTAELKSQCPSHVYQAPTRSRYRTQQYLQDGYPKKDLSRLYSVRGADPEQPFP